MTTLIDSSLHVRTLSFGVDHAAMLALLGEPPYVFVTGGGTITVMDWNCGCSACVVEQNDNSAVQWCPAHRLALSYVE